MAFSSESPIPNANGLVYPGRDDTHQRLRGALPGAHSLVRLGLWAAYLAGLGVFAYAARDAGPFPGELTVALWVQSWRTPWLDTVMTAISAPGFRNAALPIVGLTVALLFLRGERRGSLLVLAVISVTGAVNHTVRVLVARPRPADDLVEIVRELGGFSFPSGHVMYYVVVLGMLVFVSTQRMPGTGRWLARGALVLPLVAIGVSRIYLGAHWPSDVVAGYAFGAAIAVGAVALWQRWPGTPSPGNSHNAARPTEAIA